MFGMICFVTFIFPTFVRIFVLSILFPFILNNSFGQQTWAEPAKESTGLLPFGQYRKQAGKKTIQQTKEQTICLQGKQSMCIKSGEKQNANKSKKENWPKAQQVCFHHWVNKAGSVNTNKKPGNYVNRFLRWKNRKRQIYNFEFFSREPMFAYFTFPKRR